MILYLGPESKVLEYLRRDHMTDQCETPLDWSGLIKSDYQWLVSYGYRHRLPESVLKHFSPGTAINLHISYLPWNRGADPNLWSWIDDTPKGVTIHGLTEEIDKGPIYNRRLVHMLTDPPVDVHGQVWPHETLKTSYEKLHEAMFQLFKDTWPKAYARGRYLPCVQPKEEGSLHKASDKPVLSKGWDTPVGCLWVYRSETALR